ncbi:MAG: hypothetical protein DMF91_28135, partial [Acidobacteria bacterium]
GVFLLPLAAFLLVGLNEILNARRTWVHTLLLLGFLSAPLAACLVPEPYAIDRELEVLPFGVLIATIGVDRLLSARRTLWRAAAIVLLAFMPIQFAYVYVDYFTDYGARSAAWFERNIRGAVEEMIDRDHRDHAPAFYFSKRVPYIDWYWHLYLIKHGREDLLARSTNVDATDLCGARQRASDGGRRRAHRRLGPRGCIPHRQHHHGAERPAVVCDSAEMNVSRST